MSRKTKMVISIEPEFVLKTTKGLKTASDGPKNYKDRQRERFFTEFSLDLKQKDVNLLKKSYEDQKAKLREEENELANEVSEFERVVADSSVEMEKAVQLAQNALDSRLALEDDVQEIKSQIELLNRENSDKHDELILLKTYKEFLISYSPEKQDCYEDREIYFETPQQVLRKFWAQENCCIELLTQCGVLENQMEKLGEGINTTKSKLEKELQECKQKFTKVEEKINLQEQNVTDINKQIKVYEDKLGNTSLLMKRLGPEILLCYNNTRKTTKVKQSDVQMMMDLEQTLYKLFEEMKLFSPTTLNKAAKAKLKEEMRHQQEMRLEALKTR